MFCTECGNQIQDNSKFCSNCGTNINLDEAVKTVEPKIVKNEVSNSSDNNSANPEPKSLPAVFLLMGLVVIPVCVGVYFTNPDIRNFVNTYKSDTTSTSVNRNDVPATEAAAVEATPAMEAAEAVAVEDNNNTQDILETVNPRGAEALRYNESLRGEAMDIRCQALLNAFGSDTPVAQYQLEKNGCL